MHRKLAAVLCTVLVAGTGAAVMSGCGAEKVAGVDVAKAAQATSAKKTAQVQMTMLMSGAGLPRPVTITADGVTDLTKPRGKLTMDFGQLLGSFGVPASALGSDLSLTMSFDGAQFYAKLPDIPALSGFLRGKHWIAADLGDLAGAFGVDTKGLGALFNADPAAQLRTLTATSGLKKVGTETLDGAKTTHYKGSYSANDALDALPAAQKAAAKQALDKLSALDKNATKGFDQKQDAEFWLDEQGVARQMRIKSSFPGAGGVTGGQFTMNYKLLKFGVPVQITAPEKSDTYTVTPEVLKSLSAFGPTS